MLFVVVFQNVIYMLSIAESVCVRLERDRDPSHIMRTCKATSRLYSRSTVYIIQYLTCLRVRILSKSQ